MNSSANNLSAANAATPATTYAWYVVGLMFSVNMINYIDRMILAVIIEAIRIEIPMTDTQVGLLTGFAFAIFYGSVGLFLGLLADRYSRKHIMIFAITVWSLATAAGAMVSGFFQLLAARVLVGVGEAGTMPTTQSLIADYCQVRKRSLAYAILNAGGTLGLTIGLIGGGWVAGTYGWRAAFLTAGAISIPVLLLLSFTLREPKRGALDAAGTETRPASFGTSLTTLWGVQSYRYIVVSACFTAFLLYGVAQWLPAFLIRKYELSTAMVGAYTGLTIGAGSLIGSLLGGYLGNRLSQKDLGWLLKLPFLASLFYVPFHLAMLMTDHLQLSLAFLFMANMLGAMGFGSILASMHTVLAPHTRGIGTAVYGLTTSIFGVGLAPLIVGAISDYFGSQGHSSAQSLEYGLTFAVWVGIFISVALFLASRSFKNDLKRVNVES
ncbi:spinster family MFS transporter [Parahaliea mediterranea]|uniref:MFS transporter n=1 Tax=Parahaliea mediterranea TaxID=651086 RepID=A0A939DFT3_9GAMM|nr:MFS transporter [Parahaliea mediterranea]MBN7797495.1 MFS transporter [Parahaliea mediterranea]